MDCPQIRRSFSGRNIGRSHLAKISSEYLFITGPAFFIVPIFIAQDPVKFITLKKNQHDDKLTAIKTNPMNCN